MTYRPQYYKLVGREPVPVDDVVEWAEAMEGTNRVVAQEYVGPLFVSTVFLGVDHSFTLGEAPILFETMIFDGGEDSFQYRYATWEQAEQGHRSAVCYAQLELESAQRLLARSNWNE